jgi:tripartite-type tricarboxylate transporter receptor subunit TctC
VARFTFRHSRFTAPALLAAVALMPLAAPAQQPYPDKPITMIVPFPPGGVADTVARPVADALSRELKQRW